MFGSARSQQPASFDVLDEASFSCFIMLACLVCDSSFVHVQFGGKMKHSCDRVAPCAVLLMHLSPRGQREVRKQHHYPLRFSGARALIL